jgi:hypothetical protein
MLIKDEAKVTSHAQKDPVAEYRHRVQMLLLEELSQAIPEDEFDPMKYQGKMMTAAELEAVIKKMIPGDDLVHFLVNPKNPTKKAIYIKGKGVSRTTGTLAPTKTASCPSGQSSRS